MYYVTVYVIRVGREEEVEGAVRLVLSILCVIRFIISITIIIIIMITIITITIIIIVIKVC